MPANKINILILVENVMSSLSTVLLKTLDSVLGSVLKHQCAYLFQYLKIISRFSFAFRLHLYNYTLELINFTPL